MNIVPGTIGRRADGPSPQLVEHRAYALHAYFRTATLIKNNEAILYVEKYIIKIDFPIRYK